MINFIMQISITEYYLRIHPQPIIPCIVLLKIVQQYATTYQSQYYYVN